MSFQSYRERENSFNDSFEKEKSFEESDEICEFIESKYNRLDELRNIIQEPRLVIQNSFNFVANSHQETYVSNDIEMKDPKSSSDENDDEELITSNQLHQLIERIEKLEAKNEQSTMRNRIAFLARKNRQLNIQLRKTKSKHKFCDAQMNTFVKPVEKKRRLVCRFLRFLFKVIKTFFKIGFCIIIIFVLTLFFQAFDIKAKNCNIY